MSSSQTTNSPQVRLILDWVEGFKDGDLDRIAKHLHKDYRRIVYPRSLNKPEVTRDQFLSRLGEVLKCWSNIDTTVHSIIETPGTVVIHVTKKAKTSVGDVAHESIMIIEVLATEDGSLKIGKLEEFVDSKAYAESPPGADAAKADN